MFRRLVNNLVWAHRTFLAWGVVFLIVVVGWGLLHFRAISEYLDRFHNRNAIRNEIETLRSESKQLERQRDELAHGGFESEKEARERLDLVKPGEYVLHIDSNAAAEEVGTDTLRARPASAAQEKLALPGVGTPSPTPTPTKRRNRR